MVEFEGTLELDETIESGQLIFDRIYTDILSINTKPLLPNSLPFDKWDYVMVFVAAAIGGAADIVLGKPGGFKEPKSFFGMGKDWMKENNMLKNPIDYQDLKSFGGDHRLYSYGHDLFRVFEAVRQIMVGEYKGISSGFTGEVTKIFSDYNNIDPTKAVAILFVHLFKDFFTSRFLPLPGVTYLANLNGNKMPEFIEELHLDHDFNLRVLTGQILSVTAIEVILRVYLKFKYFRTKEASELIDDKKAKMLLCSHSIAMLFNIGKVVVTKNPFMLNIPQLMKIIQYLYKLLKAENDRYKLRLQNKEMEIIMVGEQSVASKLLITYYSEIIDYYSLAIQNNEDIMERNEDIIGNAKYIESQFNDIIRRLN